MSNQRATTRVDLCQSTSTNSLPPCAALVASGRATDGPDGIRTHGRSPTFTAYWVNGARCVQRFTVGRFLGLTKEESRSSPGRFALRACSDATSGKLPFNASLLSASVTHRSTMWSIPHSRITAIIAGNVVDRRRGTHRTTASLTARREFLLHSVDSLGVNHRIDRHTGLLIGGQFHETQPLVAQQASGQPVVSLYVTVLSILHGPQRDLTENV
jgi:hypothetical protein